MITYEQVPISEQEAAAFREWLDRPEFQTMVRIAQAQQKIHECKALEKGVSAQEHPLEFTDANESLRLAKGWESFVTHLAFISSMKQFNTVKLS